ncbi:hypothetical protein GS926_18635 [Rhodococcus hoagii]|nr:hypothetical protein [Prescottella equi]MBM4608176.1 hypothetical protein [Prescottella equi]MBM4655581.1 hypothetical protein [Prescottella equi]MBM4718777.1 hypothetical protein [Prescottella equi]MBP0080235.1 hypothetical protein [Prescottella equi]
MGLEPSTRQYNPGGSMKPSHALPPPVDGLESDIDVVARFANAIVESVHTTDPRELLHELAILAEGSPGRSAQIMMALAAWVNIDEPLSVRGARVEAITAPAQGRAA